MVTLRWVAVDFLAVVGHRLSICLGACYAGVVVVSMSGAPVALPTLATAQFQRSLTVVVRFVVLYGYQGADTSAEQLALTEPRGLPCLMEPTKIPCLLKELRLGLGLLDADLAGALGALLAVTCKRTWGSTGSNHRDFMVGCWEGGCSLAWQ